MTSAHPWWRSAVVYQVYPRSFLDTDGDGIGDLEGVRRGLDHLEWLGVDAVWLSPFYRSPMADFGYDVADHCDVDPVFGTLADFDRLVADAHARGIRVLVDWVPNHTSDRHPWFAASRSSREDPKRDWYMWRDGRGSGEPPNNWRAAFGMRTRWVVDEATGQRRREVAGDRGDPRAWTFDRATGQWYLHLFLPEQPDLNWANPDVREAMHDVLRFWLDHGVDGFRADVIHAIGKDPDLPDDPPELAAFPHGGDHPSTHEHVRAIRRLVDGYAGDRVVVGEVYLMSTRDVAAYYGDGDELHLAFNFPPLYAPWDAAAWRRRIDRVVEEIHPVGWPTWVLSNHDNMRHRSRYGGGEARARAAAVVLLTLRGTPFLYQGEELGLEDAEVPPEREVDPGGRDGCRAPVPWAPDAGHGWAGRADPWLPWPPEAAARSVAAQRDDAASILHLYRRILGARRTSAALSVGTFAWLESPDGVLAWRREAGVDRRCVVVDLGGAGGDVPIQGSWVVEVASDGAGEGERYDGSVGPDVAVVLRPAPAG